MWKICANGITFFTWQQTNQTINNEFTVNVWQVNLPVKNGYACIDKHMDTIFIPMYKRVDYKSEAINLLDTKNMSILKESGIVSDLDGWTDNIHCV